MQEFTDISKVYFIFIGTFTVIIIISKPDWLDRALMSFIYRSASYLVYLTNCLQISFYSLNRLF